MSFVVETTTLSERKNKVNRFMVFKIYGIKIDKTLQVI